MVKQHPTHRRPLRYAAWLLVLSLLLSTFAWAGFEDVPEDSEISEAVEWAVENGIALGTGGAKFQPDAPCTRAAFYTFLWRMSGSPDTDSTDAFWYSDAAAWAVENGLTNRAEGMDEPLTAAELAELVQIEVPDGDAVLTRGEVIAVLCEAADEEESPALDDGTPWVDYVLRENVARVAERPASPKDDLYLYANYEWAKNTELRPGRQSESAFAVVADEIQEMAQSVLEDDSLTGRDATMARQLYKAYLDWDARNALGVAPVQIIVDELKAVSTLDELTAMFSNPDSQVDQLVAFGSSTGLNDSETYLLLVGPMGLLLGDSAEYGQRTEMGERYEKSARYKVEKLLPKYGYTEAEADAMLDRALALETELAGGIMTAAEQMSPDYVQRINNEMDRAAAEQLCKVFPLLTIMDGNGYASAERYLVTEPAYLEKLDTVYTEERLDDLKNYLILSAVIGSAGQLDRESYEISVEASNIANGSTGARPDEEVAYDVVSSALTQQLDRAFLEKYDASKMKEDITRVCKEAIAYYRTMLSEEDWLSEETRAKAIEKLDAITINAVYPDKWVDDSALSIDGLGYYDSLLAIGKFNRERNISLLGTKIDHELWDINILDTNAYYMPSDNSINIIRGILGGVFYRDGITTEELYAGIGSVIGHEISHAFDTTGAQFDADGNINNWWTEADYAAFTERANRLAAYYDNMVAFGGYHVQGQNIQTEAIADMAGLKCMLGLMEQKGCDLKAFFDAYAKVWARLNTRELEYYCLMQDTHPLHYLRSNATVQQFPQFYEAYGVQEGDGMYLAPADRVLVW